MARDPFGPLLEILEPAVAAAKAAQELHRQNAEAAEQNAALKAEHTTLALTMQRDEQEQATRRARWAQDDADHAERLKTYEATEQRVQRATVAYTAEASAVLQEQFRARRLREPTPPPVPEEARA